MQLTGTARAVLMRQQPVAGTSSRIRKTGRGRKSELRLRSFDTVSLPGAVPSYGTRTAPAVWLQAVPL